MKHKYINYLLSDIFLTANNDRNIDITFLTVEINRVIVYKSSDVNKHYVSTGSNDVYTTMHCKNGGHDEKAWS